MQDKPVIDVCCGSRMFYFDKADNRVLFQDIRELDTTLCDGRTLTVKPDIKGDFRNMQYPDESFSLVVFDPPHLIRAGKESWLAKKYGILSDNWKEDLTQGFNECFRILKPNGTLIFKWNEEQISNMKIHKLENYLSNKKYQASIATNPNTINTRLNQALFAKMRLERLNLIIGKSNETKAIY